MRYDGYMEEQKNMARKDTPSAVMYAKLKGFGISNRDAANILLNTTLTFDGRMLRDRINESSQLSRRIVHTMPGELPIGLFNSFQITCPQLYRRVVDEIAVDRCSGDHAAAKTILADELTGPCAAEMAKALRACHVDESVFRNMHSYIMHVDLVNEADRTLLMLMMFVITGCLGNPHPASIIVVDYATNILGADFHTAQSVISTVEAPAATPTDILLGLVRIVDGHIKAGSQMHVLNPEGTEIGLLPASKHVVADVDEDVSRSHAYVWRNEGVWHIRDLGSVNGTRVISGANGEELPVGANPADAAVISATDIICLGATTRFIVMPVLGV